MRKYCDVEITPSSSARHVTFVVNLVKMGNYDNLPTSVVKGVEKSYRLTQVAERTKRVR